MRHPAGRLSERLWASGGGRRPSPSSVPPPIAAPPRCGAARRRDNPRRAGSPARERARMEAEAGGRAGMVNEAVTAGHVRRRLEDLGYFSRKGIHVEEQQSSSPGIGRLLRRASKSGTGQVGRPEFIAWRDGGSPVLVVECKALTEHHESENLDRPAEYAVDGALHYARHLKDGYNVVAVAVSGQDSRRMKVSVHYWRKGDPVYEETPYREIDRLSRYDGDFEREKITPARLRLYAHRLHNTIRGRAKLKEAEKPLFVGAILLALSEKNFRVQYKAIKSPRRLARQIIGAIDEKFREAGMEEDRRSALVDQFRFIASKPRLLHEAGGPEGDNRHNSLLHEFVADMDESIGDIPLIAEHQDVMGEFYNEFIRYTGGDGKGLGVVLTPGHITDLFVEVAGVHKNSRVLDVCMGTGGFLVAAMSKMLTSDLSVSEIQRIRSNNLCGMEIQPDIFALSCVNMFIRGDGRAHMVHGDCFSDADLGPIGRDPKCTVALMNPPYSQAEGEKEFDFVERALDMLEIDGRCVVILPLSCASPMSGNNDARERILRRHTLESVMIMPADLFPREGTHTCTMVFAAHRPHGPDSETWLAIWDDDGHRKVKNARIDQHGRWPGIRDSWLASYRSRENTDRSLRARLDHTSEWTAYGHLDTDYSVLTRGRFLHTVCEHRLCSLRREGRIGDGLHETHIGAVLDLPAAERWMFQRRDGDDRPIDVSGWKRYKLSDYFDVEGTETTTLDELARSERVLPRGKKYPYVTTRETNTGVDGYYPHRTEKGGVICVDSATMGHSKYRHDDFAASDHVEKVVPKQGVPFDKHVGMFVETVLNLETFRYGYGRKFNQSRIRSTVLLLPSAASGEPDWQGMRDYTKEIDRLSWM